MKLLHTISETHEEIVQARLAGKTIGLVPTMGALHEGHLTLIRRAKENCDFVVISIFVNPTQFGPTEDFNKYPRTLDADAAKCREAGVDLIFAPSAAEMYPDGSNTWVEVYGLTEVLEGKRRPGHFRGVTTVCNKLFNITNPDYAYFGMKDYQQLKVIQKMVSELNMHVQISPVEIVRESDGLAMSSRNAYLSEDHRRAALILSKSIGYAKEKYESGERNAAVIQAIAENTVKSKPDAIIDYVAVVDADDLTEITSIDKPAVVLLAIKFGSTRLIDNILLD